MNDLKMEDKARFYHSLLYPLIFLIVIWGVKTVEIILDTGFGTYGIYPRSPGGLPGILLSPVIHGSVQHLFSNSGPLLILGTTMFFLYRSIALRVIIFSWIITGAAVWLTGRAAFHIGASGLIYALASFLFFSGFIRRSIELIAISLIVVFLYGGMVWGLFPIREGISWETHLAGALTGLSLALAFRRHGPRRKKYSWEEDMEDEDEN